MKKFLVTFGLDTPYWDKCLIISSDDEMKVREYAYNRYGQSNIATVRDYAEYGFYLINKYGYKILESEELK